MTHLVNQQNVKQVRVRRKLKIITKKLSNLRFLVQSLRHDAKAEKKRARYSLNDYVSHTTFNSVVKRLDIDEDNSEKIAQFEVKSNMTNHLIAINDFVHFQKYEINQNNFEEIRHSNHQTSIINYFTSLSDLICFKTYEIDDQNIFEQVESKAFERFTINYLINMIDIVCFENNETRFKFRMQIDEHVSKQFALNQALFEKQINALNFITCTCDD